MSKRLYLTFITLITALAGLLFGYDTGVINGAQYYLSGYFHLDPFMKGWVVSSALLGCLAGALLAGAISQYFGRKYSLLFSAALFTISAYGSGLPEWMPQSIPLLVVFRIIGGLGIGIASMNAPLYIAEVSPPENRGKMVTYYQLAIVIGFFSVFLTTYFIGESKTYTENVDTGWRVMFWSELIPSFLFFALLFLVPKSPRWLMYKGRKEDAEKVLTKILPGDKAKTEISEIERSLVTDTNSGNKIIWTKRMVSILLIGSALSALQQFTGINAVLYYGADIFENALGYGKDQILEQQVLLAFVNLIFTFVAMFSVDRIGRKPLIYFGCLGMFLGFLMLAFTIQMNQLGVISLLGVLIFIGSFALSMGPVVWVVLSEIFPARIRSTAMSVAVAVQWASNYLVSQTFPMISEGSYNKGVFWNGSLPYYLFMVFILIIAYFTFKFIPETKGKTLEELERKWE